MSRQVISKLVKAQRAITIGERADEERKDAVWTLWMGGMSQREIAQRLTEAAETVGGAPITENQVHKMLARMRHAEEAGVS